MGRSVFFSSSSFFLLDAKTCLGENLMKKTKIKCTSTAQNVHPRDEKRDRIFKRKRIIYGIKTSFFICVLCD